MSKILGAVIFEITGLLIGAEHELIVNRHGVIEEIAKGPLRPGADRIILTVRNILGEEILGSAPLVIRQFLQNICLCLRTIVARYIRIILHFQGYAKWFTVDRCDCGKLIRRFIICHNGEIEIFCLRHRRRGKLVIPNHQCGIIIIGLIPCQNRAVVFFVAASVQIDSDGIVRQEVRSRHLRHNVFAGIVVLQIIVVVRIACPFPIVLREIPQHGIDLAADPGDRIAALIGSDQHPIIVDRIILILQGILIPYAGIEYDLVPVLNIIVDISKLIQSTGNAYFFCRIDYKVVIIQFRAIGKIHPNILVILRICFCKEGSVIVIKGSAIAAEFVLTAVSTGSLSHSDFASFIRCICQRDSLVTDSGIL